MINMNEYKDSKLKKYLISFSILIIIVMLFGLILSNFRSVAYKNKYKIFYEASINGKLIAVRKDDKGLTFFKLNNDTTNYYLIIHANKEIYPKFNYLYEFAHVGDSIFKDSNADTLYLFQQGIQIPIYLEDPK